MSSFLLDLRQAIRSLTRDRTYALAAIFTLALAIGANTAIFSLIRAVILEPLPFPQSDRLVRLYEANAKHENPRNVVNPANFLAWQERAESFESLAAYATRALNLAGGGPPERVQATYVSGEFFSTLGAPPALGRLIGPADDLPETPEVVVLSNGLWRRRFGGDPAVVGSEIRLEGRVTTVIGVAEPAFPIASNADLWVPLKLGPAARTARGRWMSVIGRLAPGASAAAAQEEMRSVAATLEQELPDRNAGWSASVFPLRGELVGKLKNALAMLFAAVGLVLLIACANVTGLLLAREAERQRDSAVRIALGADRSRLASQAFAECLPLAAAGGLLGLGLAVFLLRVFLALSPLDLPGYATVELDGGVLAFTAVVALLAAAGSSLVPALRGARQDNALLRGGRLGTRRGYGRAVLVMVQVAFSMVLLSGALLLVRSMTRLTEVDPGLRSQGILTFQLSLPSGEPGSAYRDPLKVRQVFRELEDRLAALPGVASAGGISWLPLGGSGAATSFFPLDRPEPKPGEHQGAAIRIVTPQLLKTFGVPLVAGRFFDSGDHAEAPLKALISEAGARELWPGGDTPGAAALGQRLRVSWGGPAGEPSVDALVVGVVGDVRLDDLSLAPRTSLYFAQDQLPSSFMSLVLRTDLPPGALAAPLRGLLAEIDPDLPLAELRPMPEVLARGLRSSRFSASLLAALAGLALLLAAVGLYGLVAQRVAQQTREVGLRLALGASPRRIFGEVLRDGTRPAMLGLLLGLAAAVAANHWLRSQLYATEATEAAIYLAALLILGLAAIAACVVPAWRATRIPPMEALRGE
jgi:putative ABC transport system permease protein